MAQDQCADILTYLTEAVRVFSSQVISAATTKKHEPLLDLWNSPNPLLPCLLLCTAVILICWVWQSLTGNCSQVDRLWSILPLGYLTLFAWDDLKLVARISLKEKGVGRPDTRLLVQWLLVALWGTRLTYNFWRKGGYDMVFEDYRWEHVRKLFPKPVFWLFNLVFIAAAQNILLLGLMLPAAAAWHVRGRMPWGYWDWAATGMFLLYLMAEVAADEQQWAFQNEKRRQIVARERRRGDFARGFLTHGFFRYSRHPAWFCENSIWWSFSLFGISATNCLLNPMLAAPVGLAALFQGSIWITEKISTSKYPQYRLYQKVTSSFVPFFPRGTLPDKVE